MSQGPGAAGSGVRITSAGNSAPSARRAVSSSRPSGWRSPPEVAARRRATWPAKRSSGSKLASGRPASSAAGSPKTTAARGLA
jgi:hypothetical protein